MLWIYPDFYALYHHAAEKYISFWWVSSQLNGLICTYWLVSHWSVTLMLHFVFLTAYYTPRGNLGCKWNENPHGNWGEFSTLILWGFPGFPAEFIRIFGGFIGDKSVADFQGNPQRFSRGIMGKFKGYCSISHFSLFYIINNIIWNSFKLGSSSEAPATGQS